MTTIAITIADPNVGSLNWELPAKLSKQINELPEGAQQWVLAELRKHISAQALMLVGALRSGVHAPNAFKTIDVMMMETLQLLKGQIDF